MREAEAIELRETQAKLTASTELNDKLTQQSSSSCSSSSPASSSTSAYLSSTSSPLSSITSAVVQYKKGILKDRSNVIVRGITLPSGQLVNGFPKKVHFVESGIKFNSKFNSLTELNDKLTQQFETTRRRVAMLQKQLADSKSDDLSKKVAELESQLKLKDEELVRQPEAAAQIATPASPQFPIRSENPPADSCSGLKRSYPTQEKGPDRSRLRTNEAGEEVSGQPAGSRSLQLQFGKRPVLSPGAPAEPDPAVSAAAVHGEERRQLESGVSKEGR